MIKAQAVGPEMRFEDNVAWLSNHMIGRIKENGGVVPPEGLEFLIIRQAMDDGTDRKSVV